MSYIVLLTICQSRKSHGMLKVVCLTSQFGNWFYIGNSFIESIFVHYHIVVPISRLVSGLLLSLTLSSWPSAWAHPSLSPLSATRLRTARTGAVMLISHFPTPFSQLLASVMYRSLRSWSPHSALHVYSIINLPVYCNDQNNCLSVFFSYAHAINRKSLERTRNTVIITAVSSLGSRAYSF